MVSKNSFFIWVGFESLLNQEITQFVRFLPLRILMSYLHVHGNYVTKLIGLKNKGGLSPINLVTFAKTKNGE
jgi:hypothetical protein